MARLSKANQFATYADADSDAVGCDTTDPVEDTSACNQREIKQSSRIEEILRLYRSSLAAATESDADDEGRRESMATSASISSFPESCIYQTDFDHESSFPAGRPTIRPESHRQLMSTRQPCSRRALKRDIFGLSSGRKGTPRMPREHADEYLQECILSEEEEEGAENYEQDEQEVHPLVLLHVTLLPINLPWSVASMRELLPQDTLDKLRLLESKIQATVLQRGILLQHPQADYEVLEEHLLEALELKLGRLTKCGHFRPDQSASVDGDDTDSDSGFGSSVEGLELCATCQNRVKPNMFVNTTMKDRWSIKVFAANGLLTMSAWAAAWREMERVDVEILPFIGDETRRLLDERRQQEMELGYQDDECQRIRTLVAAEVRIAIENRESTEHETRLADNENQARNPTLFSSDVVSDQDNYSPLCEHEGAKCSPGTGLPSIYKPSQIPLSILLKNYILLLLQDRRNVAMLVSVLLVMFLRYAQLWIVTECMHNKR